MWEPTILLVLAWLFLAASVFVLILISIVAIAKNAHAMVAHIRPDVSVSSRLWFNRFNVMFRPGLLAEQGRLARSRLQKWLLVALISAIVAALLMLYPVHGWEG